MQKYAFLLVLLFTFSLSSCQCSTPPPVGEVESADAPQTEQAESTR